MDGEFDVILLKSLKKGGEPIDEVVAIDRKRKEAIQGCKEELKKALSEHSNELQLAALAEVVDEFLLERRNSNTKKPKSSNARNKIKEVKNG